MIICAVSDLHGYLPEIKPCDLLVIAGDIMPGVVEEYVDSSLKWLDISFNKWVRLNPVKYTVVVPGNHDWVFQNSNYFRYNRHRLPYILLINKLINLEGISIWGTPNTHIIKYPSLTGEVCLEMAFQLTEEGLYKIFKKIPKETRVIISHGPAMGILDQDVHGIHLGSPALREVVEELLIDGNLSHLIHGHIHPSNGFLAYQSQTSGNVVEVHNCSQARQRAAPYYEPHYFEI